MNKTSLIILTALFIVVVAYLSTGCKEDPPAVTEFIVKVDSTQHTDTINVGEIFEVFFFGPLGDTDCYEFDRLEPAFGFNLIEVKAIGKHTARDNCNNILQYMQAAAGFQDLTAGDWTLRVIQPDGGTPLESMVHVK